MVYRVDTIKGSLPEIFYSIKEAKKYCVNNSIYRYSIKRCPLIHNYYVYFKMPDINKFEFNILMRVDSTTTKFDQTIDINKEGLVVVAFNSKRRLIDKTIINRARKILHDNYNFIHCCQCKYYTGVHTPIGSGYCTYHDNKLKKWNNYCKYAEKIK